MIIRTVATFYCTHKYRHLKAASHVLPSRIKNFTQYKVMESSPFIAIFSLLCMDSDFSLFFKCGSPKIRSTHILNTQKLPMKINFTNKNALVCGSTAGIGKATAIILAKQGATVTLVARNEDKLKETVAHLSSENGQTHDYLVADFSAPETLRHTIEKAVKEKTFHILINNTGGPKGGPILSAKTDAFEKAFSMHVICNQILVQAVVPGMKEANYGRIINIISTSVKQPIDNLGVSNTIRGAVASWSKTMANELGSFGITVNNVLPGFTATGRLDDVIANRVEQSGKSKEAVSETMRNAVPARRFAKPEEVAQAIVFLASESASYINGVNLPVDGGRTKSL